MVSEHVWKLRCRKRARPCGAKHISKSKCRDAEECTRLWREAHFQVKMLKTQHARTTFEGSDVILCGKRKGLCTWTKVNKA